MQRDLASITDILDSIQLIQGHIGSMSKQEFRDNIKTQDAVLRRFTIIGEAVKRVSSELRSKYPDIPWQQMARMRDRVTHGYDAINLETIWTTIHDHLPQIVEPIKTILAETKETDT